MAAALLVGSAGPASDHAHLERTIPADGSVVATAPQAVAPWSLRYRPTWLALGTIALDVVVVVMVTSLMRERLG